MDILSITTGSITVVELIAKTSSTIYAFIRSVRDSRSDLDAVESELSQIKRTLELLRDDIESDTNNSLSLPTQVGEQVLGILDCCGTVIQRVENILKEYESMKRGSFGKQIKWSEVGKPKIAKEREQLDTYKRALQLSVDVMSWAITKEIKKDTGKILGNTTELLEGVGAVKFDTEQILDLIQKLQAMISTQQASDRDGRDHLLQAFLENLTAYTEASFEQDPSIDTFDDHLSLSARTNTSVIQNVEQVKTAKETRSVEVRDRQHQLDFNDQHGSSNPLSNMTVKEDPLTTEIRNMNSAQHDTKDQQAPSTSSPDSTVRENPHSIGALDMNSSNSSRGLVSPHGREESPELHSLPDETVGDTTEHWSKKEFVSNDNSATTWQPPDMSTCLKDGKMYFNRDIFDNLQERAHWLKQFTLNGGDPNLQFFRDGKSDLDRELTYPIIDAAAVADLEWVAWLTSRGADVNAEGRRSITFSRFTRITNALFEAVLSSTYDSKWIKLVSHLIDSGANFEAKDTLADITLAVVEMIVLFGRNEFKFPRHTDSASLATNNRVLCIDYLLENGATARNNNSLLYCVEPRYWNKELAELLVKKGGADPNRTNDTSALGSPLHQAILYNNVEAVQFLMNNGSNKHLRASLMCVRAERNGFVNLHNKSDSVTDEMPRYLSLHRLLNIPKWVSFHGVVSPVELLKRDMVRDDGLVLRSDIDGFSRKKIKQFILSPHRFF